MADQRHPANDAWESLLAAHASLVRQFTVAAMAIAATAGLGMTAPATARTTMTTEGLAPLSACMTAHQAWVWEKAVLSVPAVVLVPPHICP